MEKRTKCIVSVTLALLAVLASAVGCDQVIVEVVETEVYSHGPMHSRQVAPCVAGASPDPRRQEGVVEWNLDGSAMLFTAGPEVYAVDSDGGGLRRVADTSAGAGNTTSFDISPDGEQFVYSTCEVSEGGGQQGPSAYEFELAVSSLDDGQERLLTENRYFDNYASWSPNGERIAFVSTGIPQGSSSREVRVYTMAADGTDRRIEAGGATAAHRLPQWSPDGEQLAFVKGEIGDIQAIYVVVADGSRDQRRLADTVSAPSWSPDGSRIAYAKADGDEVALYTIAADGTDARRLVAIRGWQYPSPNGEVDPAKAWIKKVSWSPDGSKIMALGNERAYPGIQVIGADGSDPELVAIDNPVPESVEDAAWSPDGTRIAMVGDFGRQGADDPTKWIALLTVRADGAGLRVLVGRRDDGSLAGLGISRGDISADVAACREGVAVPDPDANAGLVEDCEALLEVQNSVAGPGGLNWLVERDIREWDGIVVEGAPPRVREITLIRRGLVGEIPRELSRLAELRVLHMWDNALTGEIPAELGELQNLERLVLRKNYLSGEIPPELGKLSGLNGLLLGRNNLRGEIPAVLGQLADLKELGLTGNRLTGAIPAELGQLTKLEYLDLAENELTGSIPVEVGQLTELEYLDLSENELTGFIPAELGQLVGLVRLRLGGNLFAGQIPLELERLVSLQELRLDRNKLTGEIPAGLGQLADLKTLSLSGNHFTGCIPPGLREMDDTDAGSLGLPDCE